MWKVRFFISVNYWCNVIQTAVVCYSIGPWVCVCVCACVCVYVCVISSQKNTSKKLHVSNLRKLDALLCKSHNKILLVLRYQGYPNIKRYQDNKCSAITLSAKETIQQKEQWGWRLNVVGKGSGVDKIWKTMGRQWRGSWWNREFRNSLLILIEEKAYCYFWWSKTFFVQEKLYINHYQPSTGIPNWSKCICS